LKCPPFSWHPDILFFYLMGTGSLIIKKAVSAPKYVAYSFQLGCCGKELTPGINFPLELERNSKVTLCHFPLSANSGKPTPPKSQNQFPAGNAGKLSAINVNGLSAFSSLQRAIMDMGKPG
jgi:hypothetical protein